MNRTLRIALCGLTDEEKQNVQEESNVQQEPEQKMITMSGPLGEVYTKALAVMFAKKNLTTQEVTMESQANDAITALIAAKMVANVDNHLDEGVASISKQIESNVVNKGSDYNVNAYVVDPDDFTPEDVVTAAVNNKVNSKSDTDKNFFVIDYNQPSRNTDYEINTVSKNFDLQSHCESLGMKLIFGMENFIKEIKPKQVKLS